MASYVLLQANPATYFIVEYWLKDYVRLGQIEDWWGVEKARKGKIFKDDIVFMWKCKYEPKEYDPGNRIDARMYYNWKRGCGWVNQGRGVYSVGRVLRDPYDYHFTSAQIARFQRYYADWQKAWEKPQLRVDFEYIRNLVDEPVLWEGRDGLSRKPEFARVRDEFAAPGAGQGRKSFLLQLSEGRILWKLIFGETLPPPI